MDVELIKINISEEIFEIDKRILCCIENSFFDLLLKEENKNMLVIDENGIIKVGIDKEIFKSYILPYLKYFYGKNQYGIDSIISNLQKEKKDDVILELHELNLVDEYIAPDFNQIKLVSILTGHSDIVKYLSVIDNFIVSGSDKTIKIWDISTLDCIRTIEEDHSNWINSLTSWNDSIVSCLDDKTIKIWNLSNSSCIRTLTAHSSCVTCVILFNDRIVSGSNDNTIKIWNPNNGNCLQTLIGHYHGVSCLCILNNDTIVSGSWDHSIKIWDVSSSTCTSTLIGHYDKVSCLIVLNDLIISGSWDQTIKIWDPLNGKCISTLTGHSYWITGLCVVDEQHFISCSPDKTLKIWNISTKECVKTLKSSHNAKCTTFSENQIICGLYNGSIEIWKLF